jgi:hypothetical protein
VPSTYLYEMSTVPIPPSVGHTLDNVTDGTVKIKTLKLAEVKDLCCHFHEVIQDLEMKLEEAKRPVETSDEAYKLRAKLKELKDLVLFNDDGINGEGDKLTGSLSQTNWATSAGF